MRFLGLQVTREASWECGRPQRCKPPRRRTGSYPSECERGGWVPSARECEFTRTPSSAAAAVLSVISLKPFSTFTDNSARAA